VPARVSKPSVISLFSGAGGMDYGFEAAGFSTTVALEMNADCCETLRSNREWPVIEGDLLETPTREILRASGLKKGQATLLIGGPPCQPFSKSGYWARGDAARLDDPRAHTLSAYLRVLEETTPQAFVLENVEGLAFRGKDEGLKLLLDAFAGINKRTRSDYRPVFALLNAADYGVPQQRRRLIVVGARDGTEFEFPRITHGDEQVDLFNQLEPRRTAWDALGDLKAPADEDLEMTGRWAKLLPSIPEGENYQFHTSRGGGKAMFGWRRRYWTFLLKLSKRLPSWTIQAQPGPAAGPFHWDNRRLSMRELARLQTFPDDVKIYGNRLAVQRQLGNAVPSLLAEVLGREIRTQILGLSKLKGQPKLLPPRRTPVPRARAAEDVDDQYHHLIGEHEAHPGTGLGYGAIERAAYAV
jgi:DNA (cytosine-5)-methyltransferase 1